MQVLPPLQFHGRSRLNEPIEAELRSIPHCSPKLLVDVLFVEAQFVKHANEEPILLLGVILALICTVRNAQLMEWRAVPAQKHPYEQMKSSQ